MKKDNVSPTKAVVYRKISPVKVKRLQKSLDTLSVQLAEIKQTITTDVKDISSAIKKFSTELDSMSEISEMESLRLQMAMDRVSKMMSTLSNLLKRMSETQQSILGNLK